jgi:hypothetical protein
VRSNIVFMCYLQICNLQLKLYYLNVMSKCLLQTKESQTVPPLHTRTVCLLSIAEQCCSALRIYNMVETRKGGGCLIRHLLAAGYAL